MSQVGNALKMYLLLQTRGKCKIFELAQMLEVDERSVRRYRDDLEQAGIYIDSERGKNGGYRLLSDNHLLGLNISVNELNSLKLVEKQLKDSTHITSSDISSLMEKLSLALEKKNIHSDGFQNHMMKVTLSNANRETERKTMMDIHAAALTRNKLEIYYLSLKSGKSIRIVHPYATFQYKNDIYFMGYCEKRKKVLDFKVSRIKEYNILEERFKMDDTFDLKKSMENCFGIYKDKELDVILKIKHPMSEIVKEKIWAENQEITELDGGILFKARMRGITELKTWILGMGSAIEVLQPKELIDEVKEEINKMKKMYCAEMCPDTAI